MEIEHLFSGNALGEVSAGGEVRLPPFVLKVLERRSCGRRIVFGAHESAPCLTLFDSGYLPAVADDLERRKRRDEAAGMDCERHSERARRAFGFAEEADVAESGVVALPALLRRKGKIGARALFVGTGGAIEIWDPALARDSGGPALKEIAEYRLGIEENEEERG